MSELELRRHAQRDGQEDRLNDAGRARAEELGRAASDVRYAKIFLSPAQRAAQTVAWILRGSGQGLPPHAIVPGLAGTAGTIGPVVGAFFDQIPADGRGLVVGHTPLLETAVQALTGVPIAELQPGEGALLARGDDGVVTLVEEFRLA